VLQPRVANPPRPGRKRRILGYVLLPGTEAAEYRLPPFGCDQRPGVWHDRGTMSSPRTRRFPVTVTRLPVIRCQLCRRTLATRPGQASTVLTEHYRREHPEVLDAAANRPS
jgi:hypothetical protein